ncbi:ankyrin [Stipitochalara longipes BDJ]|nr:ankyrin [Stipitochalara longipes BDJ]
MCPRFRVIGSPFSAGSIEAEELREARGVEPSLESLLAAQALPAAVLLRLLLRPPPELSCAAVRGHKGTVRLLLDKGAELEAKDGNGRTPLSWAAEKGHAAVVKLLLDRDADMSIENKSGWTALQLAALSSHREVERLLVIHGAPDPEDFYGLEKLFS